MAFASHSPLAFIRTPASNLLCSSSSAGVRGVPLRTLGRTRLGTPMRRDLTVLAKGKNDVYPWPLDPNRTIHRRQSRTGLGMSTRRNLTVLATGKNHNYPWLSEPNPYLPDAKGGIVSYLAHFDEVVPAKKRDAPASLTVEDLKAAESWPEFEDLLQEIARASESSSELPRLRMHTMLKDLEMQVDRELEEAVISLRFQEKVDAARPDPEKLDPVSRGIQVENLNRLFSESLPNAPNYKSLQRKTWMYEELSKAISQAKTKQEVDRRFEEAAARHPGFKEKLSALLALKSEIQRSGASRWDDLDEKMKEKLAKLLPEIKKLLQSSRLWVEPDLVSDYFYLPSEGTRMMDDFNEEVLRSSGLGIELDLFREYLSLPSEAKKKMDDLNAEIKKSITATIDSTDLKFSVVRLKMVIAASDQFPAEVTEKRIADLEQRINPTLESTLELLGLKQKRDKLKAEVLETMDVKRSIMQLKLEIARAGKNPDEAAKKRITELEQRIPASTLESLGMKHKLAEPRDEIDETALNN